MSMPSNKHPLSHPSTCLLPGHVISTYHGTQRLHLHGSCQDTGGWLQNCMSGHQTLLDKDTAL